MPCKIIIHVFENRKRIIFIIYPCSFEETHTMRKCDFKGAISYYPIPPLDRICMSVRDPGNRKSELHELFLRVEAGIKDWVPCAKNEYSKLRYKIFFAERCGSGAGSFSSGKDRHPLVRSALREAYAYHAAIKGSAAGGFLKNTGSALETASSLRGLVSGGGKVFPETLLKLVGRSPCIDSLVREAVRFLIAGWDKEQFGRMVRERLVREPVALSTLADLLAEHRIAALSSGEIVGLLEKYDGHTEVCLALLRYIGECRISSFVPLFKKMLDEWKSLSPERIFAVLDVLSQMAGPEVTNILNRFLEKVSKAEGHPGCEVLKEYTALALREASGAENESAQKKRGEQSDRKGLILAQCCFYGDVVSPGQKEGGGLATLLSQLGKSIAGCEENSSVYTLILFPLENILCGRKLIETWENERHRIVRVPVFFGPHDSAKQFLLHEYEIMRAVRRALEQHRIDPDIFHVRYSDNATKAVAVLAKNSGKRLVFTITADPHRNLSGKNGKLRPMNQKQAIETLNRVWIADTVLDASDGFILIGHGEKNEEILPYFPGLWLLPRLREKPVEVLPEGIDMKVRLRKKETYGGFVKLLYGEEGRYRLDPRFLDRPILLNVGRLNPVKGQHLLAEAWAGSWLSDPYNLVLVGGDLEHPDTGEKRMLRYIERVMEQHRELSGRFCHIGALPNREVRLMERAVTRMAGSGLQNVYVCSSRKEEFGISVVEAMSEGFLVIAPIEGGVKSYIRHGINGFLIKTGSVRDIRLGMESVLLSNTSQISLRSAAQSGKRYVRSSFDVDRIGEMYSGFYQSLLKGLQ